MPHTSVHENWELATVLAATDFAPFFLPSYVFCNSGTLSWHQFTPILCQCYFHCLDIYVTPLLFVAAKTLEPPITPLIATILWWFSKNGSQVAPCMPFQWFRRAGRSSGEMVAVSGGFWCGFSSSLLSVTGIMLQKGNHPRMAELFSHFQVNYYNSARYS